MAGSGVLYSGSAGHEKLGKDAPSFGEDSLVWLASMSKLATCVAMMKLAERKIVSLGDDARAKLPRLAALPILEGFDEAGQPKLKENTAPISLRYA